MKKKIIALFLTGVMLVGTSVQAQAGRIVKPIDEQLAERKVITTPQERKIRLGEDGKPRVIITSDLEVDDMNSFIHQSLFFNEIDLAGIVVSGSFCHFTGDGRAYPGRGNGPHPEPGRRSSGYELSFRAQPLDWLSNLWNNEYAEAYDICLRMQEGYLPRNI